MSEPTVSILPVTVKARRRRPVLASTSTYRSANLESERAGDGRPKSEPIDAKDEAAGIQDPGGNEPEEVFGIDVSRLAAAVQIDQGNGDAGDCGKGSDECGEKRQNKGVETKGSGGPGVFVVMSIRCETRGLLRFVVFEMRSSRDVLWIKSCAKADGFGE